MKKEYLLEIQKRIVQLEALFSDAFSTDAARLDSSKAAILTEINRMAGFVEGLLAGEEN